MDHAVAFDGLGCPSARWSGLPLRKALQLDLPRVVNPLANIRRVFPGLARHQPLIAKSKCFHLNINLVE